jgi:hypothetical protein
VINYIKRSDNIDTQWNSLWHVIMAIRLDESIITDDAKKKYNEFVAVLQTNRDLKRLNNVKSEKQEQTLEVDLKTRQQQLKEKFDNLFEKFNLSYSIPTDAKLKKIDIFTFAKKFQDLLILACYLFQPALRNNWYNLIIVRKLTSLDKKNNYLYIRGNKMQLIMNVYKNDKSLGQQVITVRDELKNLILIWIAILKFLLKEMPNNVLYYNILKNSISYVNNPNGENLRRQIPRISEKLFGVPLSINDFRHLWEIDIQSDSNYSKLTLAERKKLHAELLHGTDIAQQYNVQNN